MTARALAERAWGGLLATGMRDLDATELGRSALVFAPHPDDETLGCGGTIVSKLAAGARVGVVIVTDGRSSHSRLMPADELARLRASEALAACGELGVAEGEVRLLGFESGRLRERLGEATARVASLLADQRPEQVFCPCPWEPVADHGETNAIVLAALAETRHRATVYEYPVWFWDRWPWRAFDRRSPARSAARALLGAWRVATQFRWRVGVGPELQTKRAALARHRSQTVRLGGDPEWSVLADVDDGAMLRRWLGVEEVFRRRVRA